MSFRNVAAAVLALVTVTPFLTSSHVSAQTAAQAAGARSPVVNAEPMKTVTPIGFTFKKSVTVPVTPDVAYDQRMRFEGPLGAAGNAVQFVNTYDFAPAPAGQSGTVVSTTVSAAGALPAERTGAVGQAWDHFLTRYSEYVANFVKTGSRDTRAKQCGPR